MVDHRQINIQPSRYYLIASPAIAPGLPIKDMKNAIIAVTKDNHGIGYALVALLKKQNYRADLVDEISDEANYIICLEGLNKIKIFDDALAINKCVFNHAKSLAKFGAQEKVFLAVQNTGGYFGLKNNGPHHAERAWLGGIAGLVKTADKEWSGALCKVIDLDMFDSDSENAADRIMNEMLQGGNDLEVGLPASRDRITPQLISNHIQKRSDLHLTDNMRLFVSGGGYGITASCLIKLAQKIKLRLAISGRTLLTNKPDHFSHLNDRSEIKKIIIEENRTHTVKLTPKQIDDQLNKIFTIRQIKENIDVLQKLGSEVIYFPIDIQNKKELKMSLDQMRNLWGGIDGFIHSAGVLADKLIRDKTDEQFARVFSTKVIGLNNLITLTEQDPLKLICLFSSVSARLGNVGQADYAMANEILNKVAQMEYSKRKNTCLVKSINWGPWESGMVNDILKQKFMNQGITLLTEKEGSMQFVQELLFGDAKQVEVLLGGGVAKKREH